MKNRKLLWLILALVLVTVIVVLAVALPKGGSQTKDPEPTETTQPAAAEAADPAEAGETGTEDALQPEDGETEIVPVESIDEIPDGTPSKTTPSTGTGDPAPTAEPTPTVDPATGIELDQNELPIMP